MWRIRTLTIRTLVVTVVLVLMVDLLEVEAAMDREVVASSQVLIKCLVIARRRALPPTITSEDNSVEAEAGDSVEHLRDQRMKKPLTPLSS